MAFSLLGPIFFYLLPSEICEHVLFPYTNLKFTVNITCTLESCQFQLFYIVSINFLDFFKTRQHKLRHRNIRVNKLFENIKWSKKNIRTESFPSRNNLFFFQRYLHISNKEQLIFCYSNNFKESHYNTISNDEDFAWKIYHGLTNVNRKNNNRE